MGDPKDANRGIRRKGAYAPPSRFSIVLDKLPMVKKLVIKWESRVFRSLQTQRRLCG